MLGLAQAFQRAFFAMMHAHRSARPFTNPRGKTGMIRVDMREQRLTNVRQSYPRRFVRRNGVGQVHATIHQNPAFFLRNQVGVDGSGWKRQGQFQSPDTPEIRHGSRGAHPIRRSIRWVVACCHRALFLTPVKRIPAVKLITRIWRGPCHHKS